MQAPSSRIETRTQEAGLDSAMLFGPPEQRSRLKYWFQRGRFFFLHGIKFIQTYSWMFASTAVVLLIPLARLIESAVEESESVQGLTMHTSNVLQSKLK